MFKEIKWSAIYNRYNWNKDRELKTIVHKNLALQNLFGFLLQKESTSVNQDFGFASFFQFFFLIFIAGKEAKAGDFQDHTTT